MNPLRELMAHLAAVASLDTKKSAPLGVPAVLGALEGQFSELIQVLAPYGVKGSAALARQAIAAWQRGPKDLGRQYQLARKRAEKKALGQVFTPQKAVKDCHDLLPPSLTPARVCDPACGAGEFLLEAARRWPGADLEGWDIDPLALQVAETRLRLMGIEAKLSLGNALLLPRDKPALTGAFDLVLGNPPWGGKEPRPPGYSIDSRGSSNPFIWFLELAHWLLKPGGYTALVLPEAWLKVHSYRESRAWVLARMNLTALCYSPKLFSGYYAPALMLTAAKEEPQGQVPVYHQERRLFPPGLCNTIPPRACQAGGINLNFTPAMEEIWEKCQQGAIYLQEGELGQPLPPGPAVVDFSLGIVTGRNQDHVARGGQGEGELPLLVAGDVTPFAIAKPSHWLRFDSAKLQQAAPLAKYQVPEKLVYKFISRELITAVDRTGALTLNSLNIIIPLRLPFSLEYLAVLLNSELLNSLYMYRFFTGKVLTKNLKQLPLLIPEPAAQDRVMNHIAGGRFSQVDEEIYQLYKINQRQEKIIQTMRAKLRSLFWI